MGLVITGASGFVGRNIVPILMRSGEDLLLVGRDEKRLKVLFPGAAVATYDNLAVAADGFDTLVHLSVRNNDMPGDIDEFRQANVVHLEAVLRLAATVGIKTFIYMTTLHASEKGNMSPYARTKREAEDLLSKVENMSVVYLRLPAVYGETFTGKLASLMSLPAFVRQPVFNFLAALKPTVHVRHVAEAIGLATQSDVGAEVLVTDQQTSNRIYAAFKRMIDLGFAIFVIVALWWLLLIVWAVVKMTSPGPGIFAQKRVGRHGVLFTCYKFRTMREGTVQAGTHELSPSAVTRVGRFLRRTKIDELPQIWNILRNELSLVGPRPCLPLQEELVLWRRELGVLDVKPGITGWAQIQGVDMRYPEKLAKLDAAYVKLRSLILDIRIIFATIAGRGRGDRIG